MQSVIELRSFVHSDDEGSCYLKAEKGGDPPKIGALNSARSRLAWPGWDASLATPIDGESIVRKRNSLRQQGISLLTIETQPHNMNVP